MLSSFWTPIVAVGCSGDRGPNAQISVSVFGASVVPDRPRLLAVLYKRNYTHDLVLTKGSLSISVLSDAQVDLIPQLGFVSGEHSNKLSGLHYTLTEGGNPVFTDGVGWFDCSVIEHFDLGDATAFLCGVLESRTLAAKKPMFWSEVLPQLPEAVREQWNEKLERDISDYRARMLWI